MCKVSDKLKLCTCATKDIYSLKHYWILHRFDDNKDDFIVGEIIEPYLCKPDIELYNRDVLLRLINIPSTFDVDINPKPKDRLELSFSVGNESLVYGFEYKNGSWESEEYDTFEWMSHHNEYLAGKIKNPMNRSKTH
jgi:hypothetical protein